MSISGDTSLSFSPRPTLKRGESVKDRTQYSIIHKTSMRHRSIALDSNDSDLAELRFKYRTNTLEPSIAESRGTIPVPRRGADSTNQSKNMLKTYSRNLDANSSPSRRDVTRSQMNTMNVDDLVDMLLETTVLEEQASIVHCLWMKHGPEYNTGLNGQYVTVKMLMEEVYTKSCEGRMWALVRLTAGLLNKRLEELGKAVTHLLVRQKQITVSSVKPDIIHLVKHTFFRSECHRKRKKQ
ncbi:unnamed protein product [Strongylus vulgaris]|uniref:Phosphorylase b kinase regulatory subunit n=1 Tax=Strongylus vulgaris TaxID=40348 RepID=A0A3P7IRL5_STRVU|nr:unnamed protein product [Strongylus vulgaris]